MYNLVSVLSYIYIYISLSIYIYIMLYFQNAIKQCEALIQDLDGTLLDIAGAAFGSVLPLSPRTKTVWSAQCEAQLQA